MNEEPIKVAVIGVGMASKPHFAALKQLSSSVAVTGVYARNEVRRKQVAASWGWPSFNSLEEIAASDTDAAIVLTPPNARMELVTRLAQAGKAILMEKPVERDLGRAVALVEACEMSNATLGIVLQHRFRAGAVALGKLVDGGTAGRLQMVRVTVPWWRNQSYYDQPGRGTYTTDGGGVLMTQAIHTLDLMLSLTGPVSEVMAMTSTTNLHSMEAEDFATAGLRFENGAVGSVVATTAAFPGGSETLELDCDKASMRLRAGELTVHWHDGRLETVGDLAATGGSSDPMDFPCDWHRELIAEFVDAVKGGRAPRITGREALRVHYLIDAIERSARTGALAKVEKVT